MAHPARHTRCLIWGPPTHSKCRCTATRGVGTCASLVRAPRWGRACLAARLPAPPPAPTLTLVLNIHYYILIPAGGESPTILLMLGTIAPPRFPGGCCACAGHPPARCHSLAPPTIGALPLHPQSRLLSLGRLQCALSTPAQARQLGARRALPGAAAAPPPEIHPPPAALAISASWQWQPCHCACSFRGCCAVRLTGARLCSARFPARRRRLHCDSLACSAHISWLSGSPVIAPVQLFRRRLLTARRIYTIVTGPAESMRIWTLHGNWKQSTGP